MTFRAAVLHTVNDRRVLAGSGVGGGAEATGAFEPVGAAPEVLDGDAGLLRAGSRTNNR